MTPLERKAVGALLPYLPKMSPEQRLRVVGWLDGLDKPLEPAAFDELVALVREHKPLGWDDYPPPVMFIAPPVPHRTKPAPWAPQPRAGKRR